MARLPALNDSEDLVALNATVDGRLVAVSASGSRRTPLSSLRVRAHLHDGDDWRPVELDGPTVVPNKVDLLPDGSLLLVQSRCVRRPFEPVPDNAQIFSASGKALRSFRIGDGVEHLAVDEPGTIWVGYFDEGIYSGDPLSAGGLTRFDEYGRQLWTYWPQSGFDHIATCYALNVSARTTWAYYYTGFPLVRITDTKVSPFSSSPVRGARGVLIHDDVVVFIGRYGEPHQLTECRLRDGSIVEHGPVALAPLMEFGLVSTRGGRLYVQTADSVFEADLAQF
ncbi:hypothetical protein BJY16_007066 [Actinoplanes octamycinicus]|uniref:Uncharacterized protein n=1 Tax=Actinoplanes octamycinicus TaxID=135948 RepID=A0A7W7H4A2_9ACTN|nr:hypothetical protein [Actinoplanes octamycinicus]MBB4743607.1 hypothetical protein [Actinoplanes octamycinicus]GIE61032.1 hypothetical protein Aoc01nite_64340 [Actinoplanes octamycinicus]